MTSCPKFTDEELACRPPTRINGKRNPQYAKWYTGTAYGAAKTKEWSKKHYDALSPEDRRKKYTKYNKSPAAKAARERYKKTDKYKKVKARAYAKFPLGKRQCVDCQIYYDNAKAIMEGWKLIGKYQCICDLCEQ